MGISGNPKFIRADVWKRAQYYSCTRKVLEYLEKEEKSFDGSLGLREMAAIAGMERTAFSKAFKRKTGITLHEFIHAYRVSQAAMRMEASESSITDIAYTVGFDSLGTFERVFKKITGTTPRHYRLEVLHTSDPEQPL
jgi:AraC-like DNA-binding protein